MHVSPTYFFPHVLSSRSMSWKSLEHASQVVSLCIKVLDARGLSFVSAVCMCIRASFSGSCFSFQTWGSLSRPVTSASAHAKQKLARVGLMPRLEEIGSGLCKRVGPQEAGRAE